MLRQVADGVLVHPSELLRNNTVVVQGGSGNLIIDPGITGDEMACLAQDLRAMGERVVAGFATHPDWDHALWHPELGEVPRYGTALGAAALEDLLSKADWREQIAEVLPPEVADEVPLDLFGRVTGLPEEATELGWDGPRIRIIEHRAHAVGHAALFVEDPGVLVAGDMLSDVLIPMLDLESADPIEDYLAALRLFDGIASEVDVVVPGHGTAGDGHKLRRRIEQDRAYVLGLRGGETSSDPRLSAEFGKDWLPGVEAWQRQQLAASHNPPG